MEENREREKWRSEKEDKEEREKKHNYQCGECHMNVHLGVKDAVRCLNCGYRILYKLRSNTWTQYEAR